MDARKDTQRAPSTASAGMDHSEEIMAEVDEPPDRIEWPPTNIKFGHIKWQPRISRRESLLTRQLHSETEHTDEDHMSSPPRTLSTQSTWSNPSTASMAELTSDDGHSVTSPGASPPLHATRVHNTPVISEKPFESKVKIVGHDDVGNIGEKETSSEKTVEANLGRKRCISFACRGTGESKPTPPPTSVPAPQDVKATSPPKRKCMLKFVCPTRAASESKAVDKPQTKRPVSPAPPVRKSSVSSKHRGSDATVTHVSPKMVRKNSTVDTTTVQTMPQQTAPVAARKYSPESDDDDAGKESMRFHEFGTSEEEPEEWVQESTCHRHRLTVDDTLRKESVIRKACEEVEEEVLEEEEDDEEEDLNDELEGVAEMDLEDGPGMKEDDDDESDEGFHSDDEGGFASSDDDDGDESDYEWWKPGGASTAATSVEHLDRLAIVNAQTVPGTSAGSASSNQRSPISSKAAFRKISSRRTKTPAMTINRQASPDLPDSTDFVCGTLDEDRPIEQAYINRRKMKEAAKHKARPQDIDPTFPTSDPEMDEEDDDDVDEVPESEEDEFMHGDLDELHHEEANTLLPRRSRGRSSSQRSSVPRPTRLHSPPPPPRRSVARSPPPPAMRGTARSPPPTKRGSIRSPPPIKRGSARSPPPRKLFDRSPNRAKSPAPGNRMTSPPNSPTDGTAQLSTAPHGLAGLAGRPQLTHTASLPRGGHTTIGKLATICSGDENSDTGVATGVPKRGAVDIVKGVEWKRQRRKEKLYQKLCAKAAAKGEKNHKVKPGKGAERMREVGLHLQQYRGKAEHILSL